MTKNDNWYLQELWNGNLYRAMKDAESRCEAVQANPDRMDDDY